MAGSGPAAAFCRAPAQRKPPKKYPAHVFSPAQPHFPISTAQVYSDKAVSTPHGRTPLQTRRSLAHPGGRCPSWKTQSTSSTRSRLWKWGRPASPPGVAWLWTAAGVKTASRERKMRASGHGGGGAGGWWGNFTLGLEITGLEMCFELRRMHETG